MDVKYLIEHGKLTLATIALNNRKSTNKNAQSHTWYKDNILLLSMTVS